jgi:translation initiation factor 2 subunit 3
MELNETIVKMAQPTMNIGTVGSVSNGKSTLVECMSLTKTQRHSKEKLRNITVLLGYANAKIFKCPKCPSPGCYQPPHSKDLEALCSKCGSIMELKKHVSFVDSPGHNLLMETMLNGTCVMDTTILVESVGNETFPAQQTKEHILATQLVGLPNSIVCLNKLDLVKRKTGLSKIEELQTFLKGTLYENSPIVPVAANRGFNIDVLCEYICSIDEPVRDIASPLKMAIIRSFNSNKQHGHVDDLTGAVVGGTIMQGILKIGDRVKILPGMIHKTKDAENEWTYKPLYSTVISIETDTTPLSYAIPGGLIGISLTLDPALGSKDGLVGQTMLSENDNEHRVCERILVALDIIEERKNVKLEKNTILMINHNACNSKGQIIKIKDKHAEILMLEKPICCKNNDYITISFAADPKNPSNIIVLGRAQICDVVVSKLFIE